MTTQPYAETFFARSQQDAPESRPETRIEPRPESRLETVSARAAYQEVLGGGVVLVDIRSEVQRVVEGDLHPGLGALHIDRFLLEWRLDPRSETRLPFAAYDARVVVLGDELTAARAARELREVGIARAAHVSGGFPAWAEAGMPVA